MSELNPMLLKGSNRLSCQSCSGIFFNQYLVFQKISKFKVGAPTDVIVPMPVHRCADCGTPIQEDLDLLNELVASVPYSPELKNNKIRNLKPNSTIITH